MWQLFEPFLQDRAFGKAQFVYRKRHEARDAVMYYFLSWLAEINKDKNNVSIYCFDVFEVFDKIDAVLLLRKITSFSLNAKFVSTFAAG